MGIGKEGENLLFFEGCNFKTRKKTHKKTDLHRLSTA